MKSQSIAGLLAIVFSPLGCLHGDVVFYTDAASWNAAVSDVEELTTDANGVLSATEVTVLPGNNEQLPGFLTFESVNTGLSRSFTVEALESGAGITFNDTESTDPSVPPSAGFANALSIGDINGFDNDDWELILTDGPPMTAFSFDLGDNHNTSDTFSIFDTSGSLLGTFSPTPNSAESKAFLGVTSDVAIGRIHYNDDSSTDDIAAANFRFATTIPEPSTAWLLLIGCLFALRRRTRDRNDRKKRACVSGEGDPITYSNNESSYLRHGRWHGQAIQKFGAVLTLLVGFLTASESLVAQTNYQWNTNDHYWNSSSSWNPTGVPGASDNTLFNLSTNDAVLWNSSTGNRSVHSLQVTAGDYTFNNLSTTSQYSLTMNSTSNSFLVRGSSTILTMFDLHFQAAGYGWIDNGGTFNLNGGGDVGSNFSAAGSMYTYGHFNLSNGAITNITGNHNLGGGSTEPGTLNVHSGSQFTNHHGRLGYLSNSTGSANISGTGSKWINTGDLTLGYGSGSTGHVNVSSGGSVIVGDSDPAYSGSYINVGNTSGTANLTVNSGVITNDGSTYIGGASSTSGLVTIGGNGQLINDGHTYIGRNGSGELRIEGGGFVSNDRGYVGYVSNSVGLATVTGAGSNWTNSGDLHVGSGASGQLDIQNGGSVSSSRTYVGYTSSAVGTVNLNGANSSLTTNYLELGYASATGNINVSGGASVLVGDGASFGVNSITIDDSTGATLWIRRGSAYNSGHGVIGYSSGNVGFATVSGSNSQWLIDEDVYVGYLGQGTLSVNGGLVSTDDGFIAADSSSQGTVNVSSNGQWNNANQLYIGFGGTGELNITSGGQVNNSDGFIASNINGGVGTVNVGGTNSSWNNSGNLNIGSAGTGILNITNNGLVTVGNTTVIGDQGAINLDGGRLEFGNMSWNDFSAINQVAGSLAGNVTHAGHSNVASLVQLQGPVNMTDVMVTNQGRMYGNANLNNSVINSSTGEIETIGGERMHFAGSGENSGEFNNYGGQIRFDGSVINNVGGFITGRGQFIANGGWTNEGVMAFSAGNTDVIGDVMNINGGQIVTSGNSTTTFYDDVIHNGGEIRTAAGSSTVFFGSLSGASAFTGTGTIFIEGDLRPGNSPNIVIFEGDVSFGSVAMTLFEIEGLADGEFDQLLIAGDLSLDGQLQVDILNGHELRWNQKYLIAEVDGDLLGQFAGLGEGDLVGNFGGWDLFVSYQGGDGNDLALFTAVPEPSSALLLGIISITIIARRRRRR